MQSLLSDLVSEDLGNGVRLHIKETNKFKNTLVKVYLHQDLRPEYATKTGILPQVLFRGTESLPTRRDLSKYLEGLYGASLGTSIKKVGEVHSLVYELEILNEEYLPGSMGNGLFSKGLGVLGEVIHQPYLEKGRFSSRYVVQEKEVLKRKIEGLINDKARYAAMRCLEEMCPGDNISLSRLGRIEDLEVINEENLYEYYQDILRNNPMDIFVVGNVTREEVQELVSKALVFPREGKKEVMNLSGKARHESKGIGLDRAKSKEVFEDQDIEQGKLTMGFRTGVAVADPEYYALLFYNGILGGFVHSKLFQNVREKASLAYYASSRLESSRGLLFISSGIEPKEYERAADLILKQLEAIKAGDISEEEMEFTRKGLINHLTSLVDSSGAICDYNMDYRLNARDETVSHALEAIQAVSKEQVVAVAQGIELDTSFFLRNSGREEY